MTWCVSLRRPITSATHLLDESRSRSVCNTPSNRNAAHCSISARNRLAIRDVESVSGAGCEGARTGAFADQRLTHGANSGCVTNCPASATHTSR